jgi:hypothetical protein
VLIFICIIACSYQQNIRQLSTQHTPVINTTYASYQHNIRQLSTQYTPVINTTYASYQHNIRQLSTQHTPVINTTYASYQHNIRQLSTQHTPQKIKILYIITDCITILSKRITKKIILHIYSIYKKTPHIHHKRSPTTKTSHS